MSENLWLISSYENLYNLFNKSPNKFIVLVLTVDETVSNTKKQLNKYIKTKSQIYPKVLFLLYNVKKIDFGKFKPMFNDKIEEYPKLIHIWNIDTILIRIESIKVNEFNILDDSFTELHSYYLEGSIHQKTNLQMK